MPCWNSIQHSAAQGCRKGDHCDFLHVVEGNAQYGATNATIGHMAPAPVQPQHESYAPAGEEFEMCAAHAGILDVLPLRLLIVLLRLLQ